MLGPDKGFLWRVMIRYREILLTSPLLLIFSLLLGACASAPTQVAIQASPIPLATASMAPSFTPDLYASKNVDICKEPVISPAPTATTTPTC